MPRLYWFDSSALLHPGMVTRTRRPRRHNPAGRRAATQFALRGRCLCRSAHASPPVQRRGFLLDPGAERPDVGMILAPLFADNVITATGAQRALDRRDEPPGAQVI